MQSILSGGFSLENFGKIGRFSRRLWSDWGDTARAATAGLGSIGLNNIILLLK